LSSTEFVEPQKKKTPGYATVGMEYIDLAQDRGHVVAVVNAAKKFLVPKK
jgi:hypothetical protein